MIHLLVAGAITGTITAQVGGAAIPNAEVRLWALGLKGWSIQTTTTTNGSGFYTLPAAGGDYLVDVRGGPSAVNYGDRWYDAAPGGGYVGEDADIINVPAAATVGGKDVALEILGGIDGTVLRPDGQPAPNMWVRLERRGEVRIHHNDFTDVVAPGQVSFRGMVPATDYQVMVYDPAGVRGTLLSGGAITVTSNVNGSLPSLTMSDYGVDPYEGNNTANCGTVSINAAALHQDPPQPWQSTAGARIGPLAAGDVDWFCFTAVDGDRLFLTATTEFTFAAATRYSPWTDPLLSFWRGARVTKLAEDDDSGPGDLDSMLDTGPLTAGCHCAAVTTFGDSNYVGTGQVSTGAYRLKVVMGNRPPVVSIKKGATEVPASPTPLTMDEGDTLVLTLDYTDADHDTPTKSFTHKNNVNANVAGGTLVLGASGGSYTWTAGPTASAGSPYVLRLNAGDSEFAMSKTVSLVVNDVDMPPDIPVLISPIGGAVVPDGGPMLVWGNAADPESDPVRYDVEIYDDDPDTVPAQTATAVVEGGGGMTSFTPTTIAENTRVYWRVRARDDQNVMSAWSGFESFLVDAANDPPEAPILVKPTEGEVLPVRRPGLSALNVVDPEDDDVELVFEIAEDIDFTSVVWTSAPVPMNTLSATTMAESDMDLAWGDEYFARVMAQDVRGGMSAWSDPHSFHLKTNLPPGAPAFDPVCRAITLDAASTEITVDNVTDPEAEAITFELEMFPFDADPSTATPVYTTSVAMDAAADQTTIPLDLADLDNGHYRYRVRAFDGTDYSAWIECELTLDLPQDPGGTPDGGCCSTGGSDPFGAGVLFAGALLALGRRRRRGP